MNRHPLTLGEVKRVRHATRPREFGAVLDDIEARLGRAVTMADLEEVAMGHHGCGAIQRKTATFVRQLPGWAGAAQIYQLSPGIETTSGEVATYAIAIVHEPEACLGRASTTVTLHPATECGATWGAVKLVGAERAWHATTVEMAWACLDYDMVTPSGCAPAEMAVA